MEAHPAVSEDIDLAIDRSFFGFEGELSKSKRTALRKEAGAYTTGPFFEELQRMYAAKGFEVSLKAVAATDSDQDPRIIEVHYPNIIKPPGYLFPQVHLEIGCRSLREPYTIRTFGSLVDEIYEGRDFAAPLINIPTVDAERTFLEKLFLLHEEFHRPVDKIRVDRLSRHLYDVYHLSRTETVDRAIADEELYQTIVSHRFTFSRVGKVDYNLHNPQTLNPIPPMVMMEAWKEDYKKMLEEMIYEESPPTFEELIKALTQLKEKLSALQWQFNIAFPSLND
ncbi:nucleotidyl transferase AbiEii/AbiGii toxin family protein [Runella sp. MFBS21]|nr:nucleotidyl transferase AbiEii/AbiGii toxin family protein [Runella sp. MFBS21]MDF7819279.1 nucleotidyl transferase AbiEii/AbiGii toxin family protein [Runella sp. MFBS21]